jgi:hypothetical protein
MATKADLSAEGRSWFLALADSYAYDPDCILSESNLAKSLRSLKSLYSHINPVIVDKSITKFQRRYSAGPWLCLPSPAEVQEEFIPLLCPCRSRYPYLTMNLSLSNPIASNSAISINVLARLYDRTARQQIKIKFGSFEDETGALFWEVGFVDVRKSIRGELRKLLSELRNDPGDYFLLGRLVSWIKACIFRRRQVRGLDLTPAYYHVTSLCRRLGGVPQDEAHQKEHLESIHNAFERWGESNKELSNTATGPNRRWIISWLLHRGLLHDSGGEKITWNPTRFIWKPP